MPSKVGVLNKGSSCSLGDVLLSGNDCGINFFLSQVGSFLVSNKSGLDVMQHSSYTVFPLTLINKLSTSTSHMGSSR